MSVRIRFYVLAKELEIPTSELLALCRRIGIPAKHPSSTIDAKQASTVRNILELRRLSSEATRNEQQTASLPLPSRRLHRAAAARISRQRASAPHRSM
jgi:hypothetical protein